MQIKEITEESIWENFLADCEEKTFLQSWNWGEFQKKMGNKIWRLGAYDNNGNPTSIILVVKISAKRGIFLLIQHGPNVIQNSKGKSQNDNSKLKILEALLNELKNIGKQERCSFVRIAPLFEKNEENLKIFYDLGFREAPMHANAYEATWKLDITLPEEELLKNMRKTTRYLIHQAEKNPDIVIEKSSKSDGLEIYQDLNREVAKRQNFTPFSDEYIKNEFNLFSRDDQALWFFGKYKGEIAAAALVIFWQGIGFYHQAASLSKFAKLSISYLLQWEAIKEAKNRGCKLYDFWGYVDPKPRRKAFGLLRGEHPWAGPTLFKMGFGGYNREYVKTQDFALSGRYWLTYVFEKLRKIKRGF